jgi:hypothetical protein
MDKPIPDDIINALQEAFKNDPESCARVIYFLAKSISADCAVPLRSLQSVLHNAMLFKKVATCMVEDTKTVDEDPNYRKTMYEMWNIFLKDNIIDNPDGGQRLVFAIHQERYCTVIQYNFMSAVSRLSPESFRALATTVSAMGGQMSIYARALAIARNAQSVARVALVTVHLASEVIKNIKRWWKGEITGVRCAKNIVDCGVGIAAGIGGGIAGEMIGAAVGSLLGPVGIAFGAVTGAVVGGALAAATAESLCDRLTQWVFGLPKSEAIENAYNFLGTSSYDSNSVINTAYRRLALKYHPDKGGDADKWTQLQYSMAVIREARGEP